ncbi:hypothetical protein AK830_g11015 [Neonectria ditissima]|uniref:F-box domain-containing protein n=1 Tax=Neonectria ditissima TaxID=78410 RepID=A0A0P7ANG8_9HYPO|nr:hypothetical protein AK830_g11015 [Neonectria ditissima]
MDSKHVPLRFQRLPFDIHFEVVSFLDFRSALNLTSTCRFFHQTLDIRAILPERALVTFMYERDCADQNRGEDLFACFKCYRLLPKHKFAKKATLDRKGKRGRLFAAQGDRSCFDCSAKNRLYVHLQPISNGKLRYYFCHNCGQYKTKSAKCRGLRFGIDSGSNGGAALCAVKPTGQKSRLETLPTHLLRKVVSFLGFKDVLHLTEVSHTLKETVQPAKWVAIHTRYRFVLDKWTAEVLDLEPDAVRSFPCYSCCRVRPKSKFTDKQIRKANRYPETSWKMRCQACIQQMYRGGRNLMRIEFKRRLMCEICKCLKRGGQTCGGCLELYVKGGIDRRTMYPETTLDHFDGDCGVFFNRLDGIFDAEDWVVAS